MLTEATTWILSFTISADGNASLYVYTKLNTFLPFGLFGSVLDLLLSVYEMSVLQDPLFVYRHLYRLSFLLQQFLDF